jgi:Ca2+-binding EF-hand superfamily protein
MRSVHTAIKRFLEYAERKETIDDSGYVNSEYLLSIIQKFCKQVSYEDWRHIMGRLRSNERGQINWKHFLTMYGPLNSPHELAGSKGTVAAQTFDDEAYKYSTRTGKRIVGIKTHSKHESVTSSKKTSHGKKKVRPKTAGATSEVDASLSSENATSAKRRPTTAKPESEAQPARTNSKPGRRMWQAVLKACQREDAVARGAVSQEFFVQAVAGATGGSDLSVRAIKELIDKYGVGNRQLDYTSCFRDLLGETSSFGLPTPESTFSPKEGHKARPSKSTHPWGFSYEREPENFRTKPTPYWKTCENKRKVEGKALPRPMSASVLLSPSSMRTLQALSKTRSTRGLAESASTPAFDASAADTAPAARTSWTSDEQPETQSLATSPEVPATGNSSPSPSLLEGDVDLSSSSSALRRRQQQQQRPNTAGPTMSTRETEAPADASVSVSMSMASLPTSPVRVARAMRKSTSQRSKMTLSSLSSMQRNLVLDHYTPALKTTCLKIMRIIGHRWKAFVVALKSKQMNNHRGFIIASHFEGIVSDFGISLSSNDIGSICVGFRGLGSGNVLKMEEFLKVCALLRLSEDKS